MSCKILIVCSLFIEKQKGREGTTFMEEVTSQGPLPHMESKCLIYIFLMDYGMIHNDHFFNLLNYMVYQIEL